jgi:RES domain-containing protein
LTLYRLHRDTRKASEYSLTKENRWNPARTPMLYCAGSVSLCCLEVLVHTDPDLIPDNLVWSYTELPVAPETLNERLDISNVETTRRYGKYWIDSRRSVALKIPSVIIPQTNADFNILLNPAHNDFTDIIWQRGGQFSFDIRLFEASA